MTRPNQLAIALHEAAITLENDAQFVKKYRAAHTPVTKQSTFSIRRETIINACQDGVGYSRHSFRVPKFNVVIGHKEAEQLRRYFDDTLQMLPAENGNSYADDPTLKFWYDNVRHPGIETASDPSVLVQNMFAALTADSEFSERFKGRPDDDLRRSYTRQRLHTLRWTLPNTADMDALMAMLKEELLDVADTEDTSVQRIVDKLLADKCTLDNFAASRNQDFFVKQRLKALDWAPPTKEELQAVLAALREHFRGLRFGVCNAAVEMLKNMPEFMKDFGESSTHASRAVLVRRKLGKGSWSLSLSEELCLAVAEALGNELPAFRPEYPIDPADFAGFPTLSQSTPKEPTMAKPIVITTKTFANDRDIATMSDSEIYELIASEEAKIKELDKIENKPKRLVDEVAKRRAGIAALVTHLDSQSAE